MNIIRSSSAQRFQTPNALVIPHATPSLGSGQISVIYQRMESGYSNPTHSQTADELMYMLAGSVQVFVGGVEETIHAGDSLMVPANTPHSISNTSGATAEWLIISAAGMQFHGADGQRMTPAWAK